MSNYYLTCRMCGGPILPGHFAEFKSGTKASFRCLPCAMRQPERWHKHKKPPMSYQEAFEMFELDRDSFVAPHQPGNGSWCRSRGRR